MPAVQEISQAQERGFYLPVRGHGDTEIAAFPIDRSVSRLRFVICQGGGKGVCVQVWNNQTTAVGALSDDGIVTQRADTCTQGMTLPPPLIDDQIGSRLPSVHHHHHQVASQFECQPSPLVLSLAALSEHQRLDQSHRVQTSGPAHAKILATERERRNESYATNPRRSVST